MPIEMPNTYDGLVRLAKSACEALDKVNMQPTDHPQSQWGIELLDGVKNTVRDTYRFLVEEIGSDDLQQSLKLHAARPDIQYNYLNTALPEGESGPELKENSVVLANAALIVRAPFAPQPLAMKMLDPWRVCITNILGPSIGNAKSINNAFEEFKRLAEGGEISFKALDAIQTDLRETESNSTGWGGPSTGPSDEQIRYVFNGIREFNLSVRRAAESRLPKPQPVAPTRTPIFAKSAAVARNG